MTSDFFFLLFVNKEPSCVFVSLQVAASGKEEKKHETSAELEPDQELQYI